MHTPTLHCQVTFSRVHIVSDSQAMTHCMYDRTMYLTARLDDVQRKFTQVVFGRCRVTVMSTHCQTFALLMVLQDGTRIYVPCLENHTMTEAMAADQYVMLEKAITNAHPCLSTASEVDCLILQSSEPKKSFMLYYLPLPN